MHKWQMFVDRRFQDNTLMINLHFAECFQTKLFGRHVLVFVAGLFDCIWMDWSLMVASGLGSSWEFSDSVFLRSFDLQSEIMAPAKAMKATKAKKVSTMKAMKGQKAMSKGGLAAELANATEMKKSDITKVLNSLAEIGAGEVKKNGKFMLPGLCMIKTRQKPATKAGKRMMFGKEVLVKAQPAKTVVKASPVAALRREI